MIVGLIDVDSHNFPNLVLMKLSSYHKALGDSVNFVKEGGSYHKVYQSKIFTFSKEPNIKYISEDFVKGGSGYDLKNTLPEEIEQCTPDYTIYPKVDYAVGYLTRGCPRNCPFCIVGEKEGKRVIRVGNLKDFWCEQKRIKLLDPNISASNDRNELFDQLIESTAEIDFTQGIDIRFISDVEIKQLLRMKLKTIHFAYDRMNQKDLIEKNLKDFSRKTRFKRNIVSVFVLVNYETTINDDMYRLRFIRSLNFQPYMMIFDKHKLQKGKSIYFRLQRWVNNPRFFWKYKTFDEYQKEHYKSQLKLT